MVGFQGFRGLFVNRPSWRASIRATVVSCALALSVLTSSAACSRGASSAAASSSSTSLPHALNPPPISLAALATNPSQFHGKAVSVVGTVTVEELAPVGNAVRDSAGALWLLADREPRMRFVTPQRCRVDGDFDPDSGPGGKYMGSLHVRAIYDCVPLQ